MKIDGNELKQAIEEIRTTKRINTDVILKVLENTIVGDYKKYLGGDDANIEYKLDIENGTLDVFYKKKVVDEITDDFLETSLEECVNEPIGYLSEDKSEFIIPASEELITKSVLKTLKHSFSNKEREILLDQFKDYVGKLMEGTVETCDKSGCVLNILNASVFLPRSEMIGLEMYNMNDRIKVYIVNAGANGANDGHPSNKINVSRACNQFLELLMKEEIRDIFNGNIKIYKIARKAGYKSKVAVYSKDTSIDPAGSCIGPNGSIIQKVNSQLGNGLYHEKIDVITYDSNDALFIMHAFAPAKAKGIAIDKENKIATVIVSDEDSLKLAIGKKFINQILVEKLTDYKIDKVMTLDEAVESNFQYQTLEEIQALDDEEKSKRIREVSISQIQDTDEKLPGLEGEYIPPEKRVYVDDSNAELDEKLNEIADNEETEAINEKDEKSNVSLSGSDSTCEDETKTTVTHVKTTTTLSDLEKSLEEEKSKGRYGSYKGGKKKKEEPVKSEVKDDKKEATYMPIYTEEELKAIEEEEEEEYTSDVDEYDEDYDEYYDDKK